MLKLTIPGPADGQMSVQDTSLIDIEKQKERQPEQVHGERMGNWPPGTRSGHYMSTVEQKRQGGETAISSLETLLPRDRFQPHRV